MTYLQIKLNMTGLDFSKPQIILKNMKTADILILILIVHHKTSNVR